MCVCVCDQPTRSDRGWLVMPFGKNPWWWYLASFVPALLVTILIFMDQQISAVIVNRKENKLKVWKQFIYVLHIILSITNPSITTFSIHGLCRKVAATTWTCSGWVSWWLCAPLWVCPGTWQLRSSPSHTSTLWRWRARAVPLGSSRSSLESGRAAPTLQLCPSFDLALIQ